MKKSKKSILILNGNLNRGGGTEKMTQVLADVLCGEYSVHILSMQHCTQPYYSLCEDVTLHSLEANVGKLGMLKSFLQLRKLVLNLNIDVIVNVDVFLSIYSIPLKYITSGLKVISWEQFSIENDMGLSWCNRLRSFALRHSDYYICLTQGDLKAFKDRFKFKTPITFIYNPFDTAYNVGAYNHKSKRIVSAGNFFYAKGFDLALEVAKRVLHAHDDWTWYFYGDGPEKENILKEIEQCGLQNKVILPGRTSSLNDIYEDAALYVLTSRTEGFGLVLLEAQCYNIPTIAFNVPYGPQEIIENEVNGILIEPFDISKMAESINRLIVDDALRTSYSSHAKDKLSQFTLEVFKEKWNKVLNSL